MTLAGTGIYAQGETLGYNPTYGNGQCTDWAERQFHAWTGTYINTLGTNGHSGNALDWAYNAATAAGRSVPVRRRIPPLWYAHGDPRLS